jgi:hypothetical protein
MEDSSEKRSTVGAELVQGKLSSSLESTRGIWIQAVRSGAHPLMWTSGMVVPFLAANKIGDHVAERIRAGTHTTGRAMVPKAGK